MAQSNLGVCYANGEGVERDYEEASFWFTLAEVKRQRHRAVLPGKDREKTKRGAESQGSTRVQIWLIPSSKLLSGLKQPNGTWGGPIILQP